MRSSKNIFEYSRGYKDGRAEQQAKHAALVEAVGLLSNQERVVTQRPAFNAAVDCVLGAFEALTTEAPAEQQRTEELLALQFLTNRWKNFKAGTECPWCAQVGVHASECFMVDIFNIANHAGWPAPAEYRLPPADDREGE